MKTEYWFLLGLMCVSHGALAEGGTCPAGYYPVNSPGVMGCAPIPNYDSGNSNGHQPAVREPQWATRWGAIAADGVSASLGTSVSLTSKRKAEKEALAKCRANGGKDCKVDLVYYNQCAVLVTGDKQYLVQGAETIELASQLGIKACADTDTNCRVHYSDCSLPVLE